MAKTWYQSLKFEKNPLDCRPNTDLIGLDEQQERLANHITKEEICFLNGLTGSGKTSMLHKLQKELKGHKFIYLDAQDLPENFNLEEELMKKRNFFDKITFKKAPSKKPVLIIDEFQATDPNLILKARGKWESTNDRAIKSIIIAQIDKKLKNVSKAFLERLGNRIVTLRTLDDDEMKEMLKRRLFHKDLDTNYYEKLSDDAVSFLVEAAGGNPRRLLEYTDMVFDFHHTRFKNVNPVLKQKYLITYQAVKEIMSVNNINVDGFIPVKQSLLREPVTTIKVSYDKIFSAPEKKILFKLSEIKSIDYKTLAEKLRMNQNTLKKYMSSLRKKKAVMSAGKKGNTMLFKITPHTKRLLVKE